MAERGIFHGGIQVHRQSRVTDGKGGWTQSFALLSTINGRITPLTLAEQDRAAQMVGVVTHRLSTSGTTDVKAGDRVIYSGRTYDVQAVSWTSTGLRKQCLLETVNDG